MPGFEAYAFDDSVLSKADSQGGVHVPEGDYLLEITGCKPSAEDKDAAHIWEFKILAGAAGVGNKLSFYASMKNANALLGKKSTFFGTGNVISAALPAELADTLQAGLAKLAVPDYATHAALATQLGTKLVGYKVYGLVEDNVSNGRTYSRVARVGPSSQYGTGPSAAPAVALGPTPNGTPANEAKVSGEFLQSVDNVFAALNTTV